MVVVRLVRHLLRQQHWDPLRFIFLTRQESAIRFTFVYFEASIELNLAIRYSLSLQSDRYPFYLIAGILCFVRG
jgi:hypothetical protein